MVQYIGFVFYGTYMYHSRLSKIIFKKSAWENSRYFATPPLVSPRMTSARGTTAEIPYWFHNDVTTLIWVVPLVGWNNISRGKGQSERYPDLDSDASSVWNFCASSLGPVQTSNLTCAEPNTYRVLKCDVIKMKFLKLWDLSGYSERTMSKTEQNWDLSPVMLTKLHTNPSKFFLGRPPKKLEEFVWSFLNITGLRSQGQFAPNCSFLASRPLGHCSIRISWQIP